MTRNRYNPDLDARATNPAMCPRLGAAVVKKLPPRPGTSVVKKLHGTVVEAHPAGTLKMNGKGGKYPGVKTNMLNLIKVEYTVGGKSRTTELVRATNWQLAS